ncbi:transglutaminase-like domain-containing protein [Mucilaginibacter lacusdianchii]|uniref:transglutaminase-like domain-containing protein n=1 Tax=Mucilaginibacter lacusdianchii TaxID=2684211 RepID=UPI00131D4B7C|nr:transglutaminase family protein [Mucilaginibacter sp. JXJ CY 39]
MKFNVSTNLQYDVGPISTLVLNIHALRTLHQTVLNESLIIDPYLKAEEITSVNSESRFARIEVTEAASLHIAYSATVDNCYKTVDGTNKQEAPVAHLDSAVLPYLYPSRYCQSDKLYRLANNLFGQYQNPFEKVMAITDWIYQRVEYLSGSTNSQTSAFDTVTEQAGVCRDFAHLGIALCRASTIPARYFTGYSYKLNPPDFHACFEAYLGGEWVLFDATKLVPLNGLVKIATGRDAADTAIANLFGNINCKYIQVDCQLAEGESFEPLYYQPDNLQFIYYM